MESETSLIKIVESTSIKDLINIQQMEDTMLTRRGQTDPDQMSMEC